MNADQIAEIRPAIREAIEGAPDTCVTLEVAGEEDKWMQVVDRTINAAYPYRNDPSERLKRQQLELVKDISSWEAGKFATFEFAKLEAMETAHWIDAYFVDVLNCVPGEYHLDVASEQI